MKTLPRCLVPSLALLALAASYGLHANDNFALDPYASERVVNLRGKWRFSIGDDRKWASPDHDDTSWSQIDAPERWESEGYRDYNGYAWYRKTFKCPKDLGDRQAFVHLGTIDDSDQVFLNGELIGSSGRFPPNFATAYDLKRSYPIPSRLLKAGAENVIAVRVYDVGGKGGIDSGRLGIYVSELPELLVNLAGEWRFRLGDELAWAETDADESEFDTIHAPGLWEAQGYGDYDGYAWYRKTFALTGPAEEQTMVLLLGRIDDYDEVYLNGVKIAGTGDLDNPRQSRDADHYRQSRGYTFSSALLRGSNTIAVRVYDRQQGGGIYEGPLGILPQDDYIRYWESRKANDSIFRDLRRLLD